MGNDISDLEVDYWEDGKVSKKSIGFVLREVFHRLLMRPI